MSATLKSIDYNVAMTFILNNNNNNNNNNFNNNNFNNNKKIIIIIIIMCCNVKTKISAGQSRKQEQLMLSVDS